MRDNKGQQPNIYLIERYKSFYDYLKHLTTLSTGSIVIMATFLDKLIKTPEWSFLAIISILGFLLSVISSVIIYSFAIVHFPGRETERKEWEDVIGGLSLLCVWLGFLIGVVCLAVFAIKNLS